VTIRGDRRDAAAHRPIEVIDGTPVGDVKAVLDDANDA
jgi:hypothetical protein